MPKPEANLTPNQARALVDLEFYTKQCGIALRRLAKTERELRQHRQDLENCQAVLTSALAWFFAEEPADA
jgi:hypothetical protein